MTPDIFNTVQYSDFHFLLLQQLALGGSCHIFSHSTDISILISDSESGQKTGSRTSQIYFSSLIIAILVFCQNNILYSVNTLSETNNTACYVQKLK